MHALALDQSHHLPISHVNNHRRLLIQYCTDHEGCRAAESQVLAPPALPGPVIAVQPHAVATAATSQVAHKASSVYSDHETVVQAPVASATPPRYERTS
ncbi:hypothetical protein O6H91_21G025600 [Diphasiastrum complanatum]|nr:hypothetical protein O6H91_21G025600 [Diphasiastrum complanatum]